MTAWASEREAIENMIQHYGGGLFSVVMDSYDYAAVRILQQSNLRNCGSSTPAHACCTRFRGPDWNPAVLASACAACTGCVILLRAAVQALEKVLPSIASKQVSFVEAPTLRAGKPRATGPQVSWCCLWVRHDVLSTSAVVKST